MTTLNQFLIWMFGFAYLLTHQKEGLAIICLVFALANIADWIIRWSIQNER